MSHQLSNSLFSCWGHDVKIPAVGRGSVVDSLWILINAFGLERCCLPVISVDTKTSPQSTDAVECWDCKFVSEGFELLSHLFIGCCTIRYPLDMTGRPNLDEENGTFVALHNEDCGEIHGLRICGALVLGNDHEMFTSRELVEEKTIVRAIVFGFIDLSQWRDGAELLNDVFWPTCHILTEQSIRHQMDGYLV